MNGLADDVREHVLGVACVMAAVAIGGLHQEVIGMLRRLRIGHQRIVIAADVAGKDRGHAAPSDAIEAAPRM